jgi:hypothetical protein
MSTQYRLVQSGKTASGGCSAGQGSPEPVAPRIIIIIMTICTVMRKSLNSSQKQVDITHYSKTWLIQNSRDQEKKCFFFQL